MNQQVRRFENVCVHKVFHELKEEVWLNGCGNLNCKIRGKKIRIFVPELCGAAVVSGSKIMHSVFDC